jgi:hypothetical protein
MTLMLYSDAFEREPHPAGRSAGMRDGHVLHTLIDEGLASGRIVRFRAAGSSMHPAICDGESIAVERVAADAVEPGTVLLYRQDRRLLAHRVVSITTRVDGRRFELRGDAKRASDAAVGPEALVGRVIGVWRDGRLVSIAQSAPADSVYHRLTMRLARAARRLFERAGVR